MNEILIKTVDAQEKKSYQYNTNVLFFKSGEFYVRAHFSVGNRLNSSSVWLFDHFIKTIISSVLDKNSMLMNLLIKMIISNINLFVLSILRETLFRIPSNNGCNSLATLKLKSW